MTTQTATSSIMSTARRGLTVAALMVFAATAGATWMDTSRAEAESPPDQIATDGIRDGESADLARQLERPESGPRETPHQPGFQPSNSRSPAQAYSAGDEPLTKNGKVLTGKLNINTADEDQLRMLPGIGPAKARRVLAYRKKHGRFKRVRDLRRVKGFGYKTVKKLSSYLIVEGKSTLRAE